MCPGRGAHRLPPIQTRSRRRQHESSPTCVPNNRQWMVQIEMQHIDRHNLPGHQGLSIDHNRTLEIDGGSSVLIQGDKVEHPGVGRRIHPQALRIVGSDFRLVRGVQNRWRHRQQGRFRTVHPFQPEEWRFLGTRRQSDLLARFNAQQTIGHPQELPDGQILIPSLFDTFHRLARSGIFQTGNDPSPKNVQSLGSFRKIASVRRTD